MIHVTCPHCSSVIYHRSPSLRAMTRRQHNALDVIAAHFIDHGHAPRLRDVAAALDIGPPGALALIQGLEERGYVRRMARGKHGMELTSAAWALYGREEKPDAP